MFIWYKYKFCFGKANFENLCDNQLSFGLAWVYYSEYNQDIVTKGEVGSKQV